MDNLNCIAYALVVVATSIILSPLDCSANKQLSNVNPVLVSYNSENTDNELPDCMCDMFDEECYVGYYTYTTRCLRKIIDDKRLLGEECTIDIENYLYNALQLIYHGRELTIARVQAGELKVFPSELTDLQEFCTLITWPTNPFNDWSPIEVLPIESSFSPGNVYYNLCPKEYYTSLTGQNDGVPLPLSFELYICGESLNIPYDNLLSYEKKDILWSKVPNGCLFEVSSYWMDTSN